MINYVDLIFIILGIRMQLQQVGTWACQCQIAHTLWYVHHATTMHLHSHFFIVLV